MGKCGRPSVYDNHPSMAAFDCFYCGYTGRTIDHYPPRTQYKFWPAIKPIKVRACSDCNTRLSNSMQPTLEERKALVRNLKGDNKFLAKVDQEDLWKQKLLGSIEFTD